MNCPNCGAAHTGAGAFCIHCGARLTPQAPVQTPADPRLAPAPASYQATPIQPAAVAPTPVSAPSQAVSFQRRDGAATIRHISASSVFKITFVTYLLLLGIIGLLVVVLPGLLGASLLGGLVDEYYGFEALGEGIVITLVIYVLLAVVGAFMQGLMMAIATLIYNLVAGWVGGVRVRLQE